MSSRTERAYHMLLVACLPFFMTAATVRAEDVTSLLERHAANKQRVLEEFQRMSRLALRQQFGTDFRDAWRRVLIDGPCASGGKNEFLRGALALWRKDSSSLREALTALLESHTRLFGFGHNGELMIRCASDPAFTPFGRHLTAGAALAEMTLGNAAEVQAFQTIFETGQNTRGYVHKLECHGQATEYIYAITDIVYGVMLPSGLQFEQERVTAEPNKVQMFYVKAGEVIALRPYVLHSGSFSVEPDRSFSILIYKKPVPENRRTLSYPPFLAQVFRNLQVEVPEEWEQRQEWLKVQGVDKYYLTLAELHTDDLKDNRGFIAAARPLRLPNWK